MKNEYRNPWHKPNSFDSYGPAIYRNNAPKVFEHRGVVVYKLFNNGFDLVFNGTCITQRCGYSKELIDRILDGEDMHTPSPIQAVAA